MRGQGFVYLIKSPAFNAVKIGFSASNPEARLRAMQTGNADGLELLGWFDGNLDEEHKWHVRFREYRIRGEWFTMEGIVADWVRGFLDHYWLAA